MDSALAGTVCKCQYCYGNMGKAATLEQLLEEAKYQDKYTWDLHGGSCADISRQATSTVTVVASCPGPPGDADLCVKARPVRCDLCWKGQEVCYPKCWPSASHIFDIRTAVAWNRVILDGAGGTELRYQLWANDGAIPVGAHDASLCSQLIESKSTFGFCFRFAPGTPYPRKARMRLQATGAMHDLLKAKFTMTPDGTLFDLTVTIPEPATPTP